MNLTRYTDYSLRLLIYLALHPDRDVPASEVSIAFEISEHHVAKAAKDLTRAGYLTARRGRGGGLRLARPPAEIELGEVVRHTEDLDLLECFDAERDQCKITPACTLKGVLGRAGDAFLAVLDEVTLADLVEPHERALRRLLPRAE